MNLKKHPESLASNSLGNIPFPLQIVQAKSKKKCCKKYKKGKRCKKCPGR
jgi:hypothetical protein